MALRARFAHLVLAGVLLLASAAFAAGRDATRGQRFNSSGVLDLARHAQLHKGRMLAVVALDAGVARQILAAPVLDQEHATLPFSDYLFSCPTESNTCVAQHEQNLIAAADGAVRHEQQRLVIKPAAAPAVTFIDWAEPTTGTADGDSETHWYLGTLPGNGFHQVEVQFGHDAPGSFLVNPQNGKSAFVHNGSDIAAPAPGGMHLVTFNADNPLLLRVAALDAAGPRLELECAAHAQGRLTAQFKGWHDEASFDLVLTAPGAPPLPVRIAHENAGWTLEPADPGALPAAGIACQAPADN